jgi:hypothetical protein
LRVGGLHVGQVIDIPFAERDQLAAVVQLLVRQHLSVFILERRQLGQAAAALIVDLARLVEALAFLLRNRPASKSPAMRRRSIRSSNSRRYSTGQAR